MKSFKHFDAHTLEEAIKLLEKFDGSAKIIAGGTDILGAIKDNIYDGPEALINIKTITGLNYIKEENDVLKIGALTLLEDIAHDPLVLSKYSALAQATRYTASPHIREMGTIGGNICQDCRCWYYRCKDNRFNCARKGEEDCFAEEGDNRYHSIFGDVKDCLAVHPSDTAPALIVLGAKAKTSKRTIEMSDFYQDEDPKKFSVLDNDEILIEIQIPIPSKNTKSKFEKFATRKSIDFPIVNCASMVVSEKGKVVNAKVCLNAVYTKPYEAKKAEDYIVGKTIEDETAEAAAKAAISDAKALSNNEYKIEVAKSLVKETLLACK